MTLELRRGDDYTIVSTSAPHMAYDPHKLSMEKVESLFSPEDRMGALEMQNLSVLDNRAFLINHLDATRALGAGPGARPRRASSPRSWARTTTRAALAALAREALGRGRDACVDGAQPLGGQPRPTGRIRGRVT